jgi:DNA-binding NtrC family response regulator
MMDENPALIRLLFVDGDADFVDAMAKLLSRRGFSVERARGGEAALRLLKATPCDAVVLDLQMSGTRGPDLVSDMGIHWPGLPVIILTDQMAAAQAVERHRGGVFQYLQKPCDVETLADTARRVVQIEHDRRIPVPVDVGARGVRLLLVDDEEEYVLSLAKALRRRGMDVSTATGGTEALARLTRQVFDVAVLDVKMPGMDGVDLLARIREQYPHTEVILLTGHPTLDLALAGMERGAFDYLLKPQAVEALTLAIVCAAARAIQKPTESRA